MKTLIGRRDQYLASPKGASSPLFSLCLLRQPPPTSGQSGLQARDGSNAAGTRPAAAAWVVFALSLSSPPAAESSSFLPVSRSLSLILPHVPLLFPTPRSLLFHLRQRPFRLFILLLSLSFTVSLPDHTLVNHSNLPLVWSTSPPASCISYTLCQSNQTRKKKFEKAQPGPSKCSPRLLLSSPSLPPLRNSSRPLLQHVSWPLSSESHYSP